MFAIMGASGNTGSKITKNLLDHKESVRVLGRSRDRLQTFIDRGADAFIGDASDPDFLTASFTGAKAVYVMIPRDNSVNDLRAQDNKIGERVAQAIRDSGVKYVANLSSLSAYRPDKNGPVRGLYDQEQRLNKLYGINILHLRPAYFMDNFFRYIEMIRKRGIIATGFIGSVEFPMVATKDIANEATMRLLNRDFSGKTFKELRGERDLSFIEATEIIAKEINIPELRYVQLSYDDLEKGLIASGMSSNVSGLILEITRSINEGILGKDNPRTVDNSTPTSFEEFAKTFARIYYRSSSG